MKGLILSGGKGTRLRPITYTNAKQLLPVANKPILYYAIEAMRDSGIDQIGIIVGETANEVREAVGDGSQWGVSITCIQQEAPLGLAHAIKTAQPFLGDQPFVMYLGDNLLQGGISKLLSDFIKESPDALILLTPVSDPHRFGVAELDHHGKVVSLVEKPENPPSNLALVGVYFFQPIIHQAIEQIRPSKRGELEITDAIQVLIQSGYHVDSRIYHGWWLDTGKKDDLLAANQTVLQEIKSNIQGEIDSSSQIEGEVQIGKGSRISNSTIKGPVVIGSGCEIEGATIGPNACIGDQGVVHQVSIDHSVTLKRCRLIGPMPRITKSLLGQNVTVISKLPSTKAINLHLGDDSSIQIDE